MTLAESRDGRPVTYVAKALGVSPQAWRLYERGNKIPAQTLIAYCKRFGINPFELDLGVTQNANS